MTTDHVNSLADWRVTRAQLVEATKYDGITGAKCLALWQRKQRDEINARHITLTPAQLQAARDLWSLQLRARVQASAEERKAREPSVVVQIDGEDYEW